MTASYEDGQLALEELIALMDTMKNEKLMALTNVTTTATMTPPNNVINMGESMTPGTNVIVAESPTNVNAVFIVVDGSNIPLTFISPTEFTGRDTTLIGRPTHYTFNSNYPVGQISLYPSPDKTYSVIVDYDSLPAIPTTLSSSINAAPGWHQMLKYQLAWNLCIPFGVDPVTEGRIAAAAANYKSKIKANKTKNRQPTMDVATSGLFKASASYSTYDVRRG
jgi:hypothetical protein